MKQLVFGTILTALTSLSAYSSNDHHLDLYTRNLNYVENQSAFSGKAQRVFEIKKNTLPGICLELSSFIESSTKMSVAIGLVGYAENDDTLKSGEKKIFQHINELSDVCYKPAFGDKAADNYKKLVHDTYREIVETALYHAKTYNSEIHNRNE